MRVAVAGAGAVGRSVTRELVGNNHDVTLIEQGFSQMGADKAGTSCE